MAGTVRDALVATVQGKLAPGERETPAYTNYPPGLWDPLRSRRREAGAQRCAALDLPRAKDVQMELERRNLRFFGTPVGLFFCVDRRVGPPQWTDLGR